MPPAAGEYHFFGDPMPLFEDTDTDKRLRMGIVFEGSQLFHHLTVRENLALPLRYHENLSSAEAEADVHRWLEVTGLLPWAERTPGALARNWQKRAGLARALILHPDVLLVDSPLAGLDLRHMHWWMGFLDELNRGHRLLGNRPLTLVLTTADLRPWRGQSRRFATLRDQRFTVLGNWSQVETETSELVHELLMREPPAASGPHHG